MTTVIVWFRSDLRVADNPALHHALSSGSNLIPIYIHAPEEQAPWQPGAASRWWLHQSLNALSETITRLGSRLIVRRGSSVDILQSLVRQSGAKCVYWNRGYEPAVTRRDHEIVQQLGMSGVECQPQHAALLFQPGSIVNKLGESYKAFTPFWRACQQQAASPTPLGSPRALPPVAKHIASLAIEELDLLPDKPWYHGLQEAWRPGETIAHQRLQAFCQSVLTLYPQWRNFPDRPGTSRLSPHLHFGEISAQQIAWTLNAYTQRAEDHGVFNAAEALSRQLIWREFAHHILHHYPHTSDAPLNRRFEHFPWRKNSDLLHAWQQGRTGIPIVDAGMRQLWQTGWMHNRVRMIAGSFLVKNCHIHWREGARWFWDTLVDANLANNSLNWQWVAGCGADAAPYHRIFNPVLQGEKFDSDGRYVRRWLPELFRLPNQWIHQPWAAPQRVLIQAGLRIGTDYAAPVVDLAQSRRDALALFRGVGELYPKG